MNKVAYKCHKNSLATSCSKKKYCLDCLILGYKENIGCFLLILPRLLFYFHFIFALKKSFFIDFLGIQALFSSVFQFIFIVQRLRIQVWLIFVRLLSLFRSKLHFLVLLSFNLVTIIFCQSLRFSDFIWFYHSSVLFAFLSLRVITNHWLDVGLNFRQKRHDF